MDEERKMPAVVNLVDSDSEDSLEATEKKRWSAGGMMAPVARDSSTATKKARSSSQHEAPIKLLATVVDIEERKKHSSAVDKTCHPSWTQCRTLRELLGLDGDTVGKIDWLVVTSYIINFEFLVGEVPELLYIPTAAVFYGSSEAPAGSRDFWKSAAADQAVDFVTLRPSDPHGSPTNPLQQTFECGVHHSKIFLVGFSDGRLRVIIHTANLRYSDIHLKAQAAYVQDFPLKTKNSAASCAFEQDLISYFATYHYHKRRQWRGGKPQTLVECLADYDFSSASAVLIPSTPGKHKLNVTPTERRGHWKLRHAIAQHCDGRTQESRLGASPIICQFSSVGSLSEPYLRQLRDSMDVSTAQRPSDQRPGASNRVPLRQTMRLVYPTVEEIRTSVEGYLGGGSVPGREKNVEKNCLMPLYHKWSGSSHETSKNPIWKSNHVPHIKTYYQIRPNANAASMEWFVLTSHNLSKAAWGEIQNTNEGRRLVIFHWELGVFLSPSLLQCQRLMPWSTRTQENDNAATVPLPFPLFPRPYGDNDHPWVAYGGNMKESRSKFYPQADPFGRHSVAG